MLSRKPHGQVRWRSISANLATPAVLGESMGGHLEMVAIFGDERIALEVSR